MVNSMERDVIKINEEKCNGCGVCVTGCPEGDVYKRQPLRPIITI